LQEGEQISINENIFQNCRDFIVDIGSKLLPIEIKASKTYSPGLKSNILSWLNLKNNTSEKGLVIYRGESVIGKRSAVGVIPWWYL